MSWARVKIRYVPKIGSVHYKLTEMENATCFTKSREKTFFTKKTTRNYIRARARPRFKCGWPSWATFGSINIYLEIFTATWYFEVWSGCCDIIQIRWYFGRISRYVADGKLMGQAASTFLVRRSDSNSSFILSVKLISSYFLFVCCSSIKTKWLNLY